MDLQALSSHWQETKDEVIAHYNKLRSKSLQFDDILDGRPADNHTFAVGSRSAEDFIKGLAESRIDSMFAKAIKMFSPDGLSLKIDRDKILSDLGYRNRYGNSSVDNFDPAVLWKEIDRLFGGDKGKDQAYAQVAEILHRKFRMAHEDKVKSVAGAVCLNINVYLDSFDKKYGKNKLSYSSADDVSKAMTALAAFAKWASRPQLAIELERHPFGYSSTEMEPRKRYPFGEREVEIITYTSRFEFRFSMELASELQVFIGSYGPIQTEVEA
jgi:hypothetical protein